MQIKDTNIDSLYLVERKTTKENFTIKILDSAKGCFSERMYNIQWIEDESKCWIKESKFNEMYNIIAKLKKE